MATQQIYANIADSVADHPAKPVNGARVLWLDVVKGIGIVLVVIGHTLGGLMDSPIGAKSLLLREIFLAIYLFHMPLFFFLSGLLVQRRIARGRTAFLLNILATVVYPYFLWSIVQYSAIYAAGSLVNRPVTAFWAPILNLPRVSISQFWFLYVLFVLHMAALLLVPRIGARPFLGLAVIGKLVSPFVPLTVMFRLSLSHGLFYALGVACGPEGVEAFHAWLSRRPIIAYAIPVLAIVAIVIGCDRVIAGEPTFGHLHSWEISARAWRLGVLPVAVLGVMSCLIVAHGIRGRLADMLVFLGQRTMAIFVLHVLFIAGVRIVLKHVVPLGLWPMVGVCLIAGLCGPLIVHFAIKRVTSSRVAGIG